MKCIFMIPKRGTIANFLNTQHKNFFILYHFLRPLLSWPWNCLVNICRTGKVAATTINANQDRASKKSLLRPPVEEENELPFMWHELANKLLQSFNKRFDRFERSFKNILSAQQELKAFYLREIDFRPCAKHRYYRSVSRRVMARE